MKWQVYLSGEIHTDWRERIERGAAVAGLDLRFTSPVTDHAASDAAGTAILGERGASLLERPPRGRSQRDPHAHADRAS
ncbi:MAG TPA: YtoQ family protein [Conexibacter sp.]